MAYRRYKFETNRRYYNLFSGIKIINNHKMSIYFPADTDIRNEFTQCGNMRSAVVKSLKIFT